MRSRCGQYAGGLMPWALGLAAALVLATGSSARADMSEALNQVAEDAEMVIVVPNLGQFNEQIAALRQQTNLPVTEMDDVLTMMRRQMGIQEGLDEQGSLLVTLSDVPAAMQAGSPPTVTLLAPVSDYGQFVGNFGGDAGEQVTSLTMPMGHTAFSRQVGNYAVLSDNRQRVEAYEPGQQAEQIRQQVGEAGQEYLGTASIAAYINFEQVGPAMRDAAEQQMDQFQQDMEAMGEFGMDEDALQMMEVGQEIQSRLMNVLAEDALAGLATLQLDDAGVGLTYAFNFRPDSEVMQFFPGGQSDAADQLAELPDRPFIYAAAIDNQAIAWDRVTDLVRELVPDNGEDSDFVDLYLQAFELSQHATGTAGAFYVPDQMAMMGGGLFNMVNVYRADDANDFKARHREYVQGLDGVQFDMGGMDPMGGMGQMNGAGEQITLSSSYTEDALQVDGVSVDQFQLQFGGGNGQQQQQPGMGGGMMAAMGYQGYVAATDGHVITTTTTDPEQLRAAIQSVQQGEGIGTSGPIQGYREQALAANAAVESYLSLQGIADTANLFMGMMGGEQINIGQDVPPIAMSAGVQGDGLAMRMYVPNDATRAIVDTVQRFGGMMGPAMGPQPQPQGPQPAPF